MLGQYLPVVALVVLVVLFAAVSTVASRLLAPRAPHQAKTAPYECGIVPTQRHPRALPGALLPGGDDLHRLRHRADLHLSVVHDLPGSAPTASSPSVIFAFAVFESFVYLIGNGALEWGPLRRSEQSPLVSASRTSSSTVRRVGLEGRLNQPAPTEEDAA